MQVYLELSEDLTIASLQLFSCCNNGDLNILSRNKFLALLKGYNSATNKQNMGGSNPSLDLINTYALIQFGEFLSICSQYIEWKRNSDVYQGP